MSEKAHLHQERGWPRWAVIPIGLGLAAFAVVLGLVLEPAGYALSPGKVEPTPTIPAVAYGRTTAISPWMPCRPVPRTRSTPQPT
jgi:hypothetical protein